MKRAAEKTPLPATNMSLTTRPFLLLILTVLYYPVTPIMAKDSAGSHVILEGVYDADCEIRGGKLIVVHSDHPNQVVEAQLERYFMKVRQGGRTVVRLHPGASPRPLGCSRVLVDRAEQHWQLVEAIYLD